jgi:hypothetical protein
MSAVILQHPASRPFIAIAGGTGAWTVCRALGTRMDLRYQQSAAAFETLPEAQAYAAELATHFGLPVEIRAYGGGAGAVA